MKVLFIGGTGLISEAVSKLAVEKEIELYLFNRGHHSDSILRERMRLLEIFEMRRPPRKY